MPAKGRITAIDNANEELSGLVGKMVNLSASLHHRLDQLGPVFDAGAIAAARGLRSAKEADSQALGAVAQLTKRVDELLAFNTELTNQIRALKQERDGYKQAMLTTASVFGRMAASVLAKETTS